MSYFILQPIRLIQPRWRVIPSGCLKQAHLKHWTLWHHLASFMVDIERFFLCSYLTTNSNPFALRCSLDGTACRRLIKSYASIQAYFDMDRIIRAYCNRSENLIWSINISEFNLRNFKIEFNIKETDNLMYDCYKIEPHNVPFIQQYITNIYGWDFDSFSYFLETECWLQSIIKNNLLTTDGI